MPKWVLGHRKDKKKPEKEVKAAELKNSRKISPSAFSPHHHLVINGTGNRHDSQSAGSMSPTPSNSSQEQAGKIKLPAPANALNHRRSSGPRVAIQKAFYEDLTMKKSTSSSGLKKTPSTENKMNRDFSESVLSNGSDSTSKSTTSFSPPMGNKTVPYSYGGVPQLRIPRNYSPSSVRHDMDSPGMMDMEKGKRFEGIDLPLPQLQMTAVRLREVDARRNVQSGGFGFILRKSYLPSPEEPDKTKLVHLIEPRLDYYGPLMTGDRIIEVNGEDVEDSPHEAVVEMIKASRESVNLRVASMPELLELNVRGALDDPLKKTSGYRKLGRAKLETGQFSELTYIRCSIFTLSCPIHLLSQHSHFIAHSLSFYIFNIFFNFLCLPPLYHVSYYVSTHPSLSSSSLSPFFLLSPVGCS